MDEEYYKDLQLITPQCIFAFVFDKFHGEGYYIGFNPTSGYCYRFGSKEIVSPGYKPLCSIVALQSFPFTPEQVRKLHETYPPGYTE